MENLGSFLSSIDEQLTTQLNSYGTYDYNWVQVDDTTGGTNYAGNYINFDRVNIKSTVLDEVYHLSEAVVGLVWEETLTITGGATFKNSVATTTYSVTNNAVASNALTNTAVGSTTVTAVGSNQYTGKETKLKGLHHLVDNVALDLGSQSVSRNSALMNLYNEMDLKKLKKDEYERVSDSLRWTCEDNDAKVIYDIGTLIGIQGCQTINKSLKSNILDKRDRDFSSEYTFDNTNLFANTNDVRYKKVLKSINAGGTEIVYKCYGLLPLKYVHNIFGKLPSVLHIDGFRLQLQMNIGENNSWTINYPITTATTLNTISEIVPTGFTSTQSTGRTCPFYFGKAGWNLSDTSTDMYIRPGTTEFTVKCEMKINPNATEKIRLYIPYTKHMNFNAIVKQPKARILYEDIFIDYGYNVQANANFARQFNFELKRMRWLFIFPFIRSVSGIDLSELRSPMFNGGVEVSPYWIDDFQIQINSNPIFKTPLKYKWQFYEYYKMFLGSNTDGNCYKSENMSGLITMDMYQKTHGIIAIDLQKVLSEQLDGSGKQILIEFRNRANVAYDFLFMISTQFEIGFDRNTCQITKA